MCQVNEDDMNNAMEAKLDYKVFRKCLKCDANSVVITRINEALCKECFQEYFTHKFRATIGKNKILEKDEIVLFPYSASSPSVAMLHLIARGVSEEAKKKFTFKTILLYIEDSMLFESNYDHGKRIESIKKIRDSIKYSNFKAYFSLLENSFSTSKNETNTLFTDDDKVDFLISSEEKRNNFVAFINSITNQTSREEMIKRFRLKLINQIANTLGIRKVLFAMSCTKLTIELLNNVAIGKGAHVASEASLEEKHDNLIYLRPLRFNQSELTSKEIAFYNHYNGYSNSIFSSNTSLLNVPNSTIYRLTEKFINGLQNDYPTTVATIFRTSDKLTPSEDLNSDEISKCILCENKLDTKTNTSLASSAINDLEFSNQISRLINNDNDISNNNNSHDLIMKNFCYSCSIMINDSAFKNNLPECLREKLRDEMKNSIKEFLIQSD